MDDRCGGFFCSDQQRLRNSVKINIKHGISKAVSLKWSTSDPEIRTNTFSKTGQEEEAWF